MRRAVALGVMLILAARPVIAQSSPAAPSAPAVIGSRSAAVIVASKPFGESYLLAELFAQLLESRGIAVDRRPGLGATEIAFGALRTNAIGVYPEYTGTGLLVVLRDSMDAALRADPPAIYARVARESASRFGVRWLSPLGFQNTYAIAVRREMADRLKLRTISDLAREGRALTAGLTADFIGRADGLVGLSAVYRLHFRAVRPLAPAVKYLALAQRAVDVIDGYSTDGLLAKFDLVTLVDDRHFFPPYEAAAVVSPSIAATRPDVIATLALLSDRLDETRMRALNRRVEVDGEPIPQVAAQLLGELGLVGTAELYPRAKATSSTAVGFWAFLWSRRAETAAMAPRAAGAVIGALGVLQTIPSIALLAFMIPLLGVGVRPALVALWLYALYPIVRNTYTGVRNADPDAVEASEALGATARQRLLWVRLPIAAPVILAGVRTSAVITVGAATLAAFIGAGGLGEPIVAGLALADTRLVLSGALPAALLALLVDGVLAVVERAVTPPHLRRGTQ
jgi:osmoprotectant transport system permease protein